MIIALDFDGTLVENHPEFPGIGEDNGAGPWLVKAAEIGAQFVLFTCRDGAAYAAATEWCAQYLGNLGLTWISGIDGSGKQRAQLYVDDKALGAPLKQGHNGRPCVDWEVAGPLMLQAIYRRQTPTRAVRGEEMPLARWQEIYYIWQLAKRFGEPVPDAAAIIKELLDQVELHTDPTIRHLAAQLTRAKQVEEMLEMMQLLNTHNQHMSDLRKAGNALADEAYHEQRRGFTSECLPTCRVCAWNRLSP